MEFINDMQRALQQYGTQYLEGAGNTLLLALVGTIAGCLIGFVVGTVQSIPLPQSKGKRGLMYVVRGLLRIYVEVFRGTPMIVQSVFIYYGAFYLGGGFSSPWSAGILVVSINTGAYMAETVRGGILSIDPGQMEGAKAIGMAHTQAMVNVILPQALRNIVPQIGNNFIINIKDTSVLSVISFADLFFVHKSVSGSLYLYFPSAVITMVIYLTMTLLASFLLRRWEAYLAGDDNYEMVNRPNDTLEQTSGLYRAKTKGEKR